MVPLSAPAGGGKTTSMRALRTIVERRSKARMIVIAPTGKAVDVALAEGAASEAYTMHAALKRLADGQLGWGRSMSSLSMNRHGRHRSMAPTLCRDDGGRDEDRDGRRRSPTGTGQARGGMFAQLCDELPGLNA